LCLSATSRLFGYNTSFRKLSLFSLGKKARNKVGWIHHMELIFISGPGIPKDGNIRSDRHLNFKHRCR
jgi:hypothetical protein